MRISFKNPSSKSLHVLLVIFSIMISFVALMPSYLSNEFQVDKLCLDSGASGAGPGIQQHHEENSLDKFSCSSDNPKQAFTLYILGMMNINELTMWVLGVDRRLLVLKMMHEKKLLQASDIADRTERSLQNISYAMRELEEKGLIKCITPEKATWKKFIPTEKGTAVFENLKKNNLISS